MPTNHNMGNAMGATGLGSSSDLQKNSLSQLEFAVKMTCKKCTDQISEKLLDVPGIDEFNFDLDRGSVLVKTSLPSYEIQQRIESTGREAVLRGVGGQGQKNLGAAVAMLGGECGFSAVGVHGVVRFMQVDEDSCVVDGTIDGLSPGKHGLHVHECGDISRGCESVGTHYNPYNKAHGSPSGQDRHVGDLGNVVADQDGRAVFRFPDHLLKVWDIIGRSIVVTEAEDDFGRGNTESSKEDGNSGQRLACGIIARSAGLFENSKKICACDGLTIWDEKNAPLAGSMRQLGQTSHL